MNIKILSMTGFSSLSVMLPVKEGLNVTMTLKSLNSRYFEFNAKLPFSLSKLELTLMRYFKSKLHRGNVSFSLYISNPSLLSHPIEPDFSLISQYINSVKLIKEKYAIIGDFEIKDLIKLPNIFLIKEEPIEDNITNNIMFHIDKMVESLIETRILEGKAIGQDLLNRILLIKEYIDQLEPRSKIVVKERQNTLNQALESLAQYSCDNNENNSSLKESQSLIIYNQLEKIDIHEEIVRFKTHVDSLIQLLESSVIEKGKKIDFTLQELFREINTIAAKCSDSIISSIAINIKVEIEKAREQAQNIV